MHQDRVDQMRELRHPAHRAPASSPHTSNVRRLRSDESWVDISARTSTSSLSSAAADETLTPSRVQPLAQQRRRRIQRSNSAMTYGSNGTQTTAVTDSSQEEYEESESEQDPVMTSSNEDLPQNSAQSVLPRRQPIRRVPSSESSDALSIISSNDGTALGAPAEPQMAASFRPQPNAFTHTPNIRAHSYQQESPSYFSPSAPMARAASTNTVTLQPGQASNATVVPATRPTYNRMPSHGRTRSHTPYNMLAPNHSVSVDHDAALRASLSTLLSCAAAARGIAKRDEPSSSRATATQEQGVQGLRLVAESELDSAAQMLTQPTQSEPLQETAIQTTTERPSTPRRLSPKRKSKSKSPSPSRRRKVRPSTAVSPYADLDSSAHISPTMLWVIGAGVFVLGSAVLFSAGYAIGKEVGYVNGLSDSGMPGCRNEAGGLSGGGGGLKGMGRRGWRSATTASIWGVS